MGVLKKQPSCYEIPHPQMTIIDLTALGQRDLNFAMLSLPADIVMIAIDATFGIEKRDLWIKSLACLAAISHIVFLIDNIYNADSPQGRFEKLRDELEEDLVELECGNIHILPVDLNTKDNIEGRSSHMTWYKGAALLPLLADLARPCPSSAPMSQGEQESDQFAVYLSWLSGDPMLPGRQYSFEHNGRKQQAHVSALKYRFNPETLEHMATKRLFDGDIGYGNISLEKAIPFVPFKDNQKNGSFRLKDRSSGDIVAFGLIKHGLRRATNIRWQVLEIDKASRATSKQQKPCVLWFTGLSGSGKSTIASLLEKRLHTLGRHTYVLDGDNVRHGLCRDLGFTDADRVENQRRISETAKLFVDAGLIVLVSFISPFRSERQAARELFDEDEFVEIFVDTSLEICEARDPKGLYKKARAGQLRNFTGLDSPYEPPEKAELTLPGGQSPDRKSVV